jgi:hypothetical protein
MGMGVVLSMRMVMGMAVSMVVIMGVGRGGNHSETLHYNITPVHGGLRACAMQTVR